MTETLTNPDLPALLADLRARGVTFVLKGNALKVRPWPLLTADEQRTVQANRPALKALVRAEGGSKPDPGIIVPTAASPALPPPEPCSWCYRSPCVGIEHDALLRPAPR